MQITGEGKTDIVGHEAFMCKAGIGAIPVNWFFVKGGGGSFFRKTFFTKRFKKEQLIDMTH